jgi:hypothetical protein
MTATTKIVPIERPPRLLEPAMSRAGTYQKRNKFHDFGPLRPSAHGPSGPKTPTRGKTPRLRD